ncbi:MAG: hypothetical protein HYZ94_02010 [Candidatus Omnitrophica bacterium]|nr:hypothetical protein [Candidatus Omnitrophota bacterium]
MYLVPVLGFGVSFAFADDVFFKAGGSLRGLVVEEHADRVVMSTEGGEKTVLRDEIDEVFFSEPERNELYLGERALQAGDLAGAREFFLRAIRLNPRLAEGKDALGRVQDMERKAGQAAPRDPAAELAKLGVALRKEPQEGWLVIELVERGSTAQRWGLSPGDALAAYWGGSLRHVPPAEAARSIAGAPGSALKLTIQRQVNIPPANPPNAGWPGLTLEMEHFGLTARETVPTSPAFMAGLRPGDRVVRLGAAPTRYMPLGAARKALQQAREKGIILIIHRDLMVTREGKTDA